jgi:hypothetical protein
MLPERLVLEAEVSRQDDGVGRFLQGGGLTFALSCPIRFISLHFGSQRYGLKSASDSVKQFGDSE